MKYRPNDENELPGQDSFLDIVANIVGILIILVTVVGVRAGKAPLLSSVSSASDSDKAQSGLAKQALAERKAEQEELRRSTPNEESLKLKEEELHALRREAANQQAALQDLAKNVILSEQQLAENDNERVKLLAVINTLEETIEKERQALGKEKSEQLRLQEQLRNASLKLDDLAREQFAAEIAPAIEDQTVEKIENLPTPLAKTVSGEEIHVRLKNGRVSVIPLEPLIAVLKTDAKANAERIGNRSTYVDTVGPIGGYRMRYRLEKKTISVATHSGQATGIVVQLDRWELLPVADDLGVPVAQALLHNSELSKAMQGKDREQTVVTLWVYPDSFQEFRTLKKDLFDLGYATAGRPMPDGIRIGGSPNGSKSSAQ